MRSTAKWEGVRFPVIIVYGTSFLQPVGPQVYYQSLKRQILPGSNERPADIYVGRWPGGGPAAFDVAVVSPLKTEYVQGAATTNRFAATAYADRKASSEQTERRCRERGVRFVPLVVETFGAWCDESRQAIQKIAGLGVPRQEGSAPQDAVRTLFQRLSVELVRSNAQMLLNRNAVVSDTGCPLREAALRQVSYLASELRIESLVSSPTPALPPPPIDSRILHRIPLPPPELPPDMTPPPGSSGPPTLLPGSPAPRS